MSQTAFTRLELKIPPPVVVGVGGLLNWFATRWADNLFSAPWLLIGASVIVSGVVGGGVRGSSLSDDYSSVEY